MANKQNAVLDRIVEWNKKRGLLDKDFNQDMEAGFIIEEVLEMYGFDNAREYSKAYIQALRYNPNVGINNVQCEKTLPTEPEDVLDAFSDIFVYCVGGLAKQTESVSDVIDTVMDANDAKGSKTDAQGKIIKKDDFVNPDLSDKV